MKKPIAGRCLDLKIEAKSGEDLRVLLRQALYEIEKELPPSPDGCEGGESRELAQEIMRAGHGGQVVGHTAGSLGSYRFEFLHTSRRFFELEKSLLEAGYTRDTQSESFWEQGNFYVHPSLTRKCIQGDPMEICDAPRE